MKKFIMGMIAMIFMNAVSYGAVLSFSPQEGKIPENCIQPFSIVLDMRDGEQAITSDLVVTSNMEFVDFKNGNLFKYSVPPYIDGNKVSLMLFNDKGGEITNGGFVGTLYYKTENVVDPYIDFTFYEKGDTRDTNININGKDILTDVINGKYELSDNVDCENPVYVIQEQQTIDEFVKDFESDHKGDQMRHFLNQYKCIIFGGVISLIIIVLIIILVSHRIQKKGGK